MAFRSEADAREWENDKDGEQSAPIWDQPGHPGATVPVEMLGKLSRRWYGGRLDDEWRPSSAVEKQAILHEAGMHGAFWELG